MKVAFKILLNLFIYLMFFAIFTFGAVIFYLSDKEKNIPPQIISSIENLIESSSSDLEFYVAGAQARFVDFSKGFEVTLKDSYMQFGNNVSASIPKAKLNVGLKNILLLRPSLGELSLVDAQFVITNTSNPSQQKDDFLDVNSSRNVLNIYKQVVYGFFDALDKRNNVIPVERVDLQNASFSVNRAGKYENWRISDAGFRFYKLQNSTYLSTEFSTEIFGHKTHFLSNARLLDENQIVAEINFTDIPSSLITTFWEEGQWLTEIRSLFSGRSVIVMDKKNSSTSVSVETDFVFEKEGLDKTKIAFFGVLDLKLEGKDNNKIKPVLQSKITISDLKMNQLPNLWPEELAPITRGDVMNKLSDGLYKKAVVNLEYGFKDTKFDEITSEKLIVSGDISNATVLFNKRFPEINNVSGEFEYGISYLDARFDKAIMSGLDYKDVELLITGLETPNNVLEIKGSANGELQKLKPLLSSIMRGRDKNYYYNRKKINAVGEIDFYYFDNIDNAFDLDFVKLDITSKLSSLEIEDLHSGLDFVANAEGKTVMKFAPQGLTINTKGILGESSEVDGEIFVGFDEAGELNIDASGVLDSADISKLAPIYREYVKGDADAKLNYKSKNNQNSFSANVDLAKSQINIPYISWNKSIDEFANLNFFGRFAGEKAIIIKKFNLSMDNSVSNGSALISLDGSLGDEIYFKNLDIGENTSEVYFSSTPIRGYNSNQKTEKAYILKVNGNSFDMRQSLDSSPFHKEEAEKQGKEVKKIGLGVFDDALITVDMDVDNLLLPSGVKLQSFKASLDCNKDYCVNANVQGNFATGGILKLKHQPIDFVNPDKRRDFVFETDNFGRFVEALGFENNLKSGRAVIRSKTEYDGGQYKTEGEIRVDDFKIIKAPLLTRILSLASITSLAEIFSGKGFNMQKMVGEFEIRDRHFILNELQASGNALGITSEGNFNFDNNLVDFSGAVTPSYSVNSFLGKIPVLGRIFSPNKGEGLIATRYGVKGDISDPKVTVNPLSVFTPGFLRSIWSDSKTDVKATAKKKKSSRVRRRTRR